MSPRSASLQRQGIGFSEMHDFSPAASQSNTFSTTVYSIRTSPSFILPRGRAGEEKGGGPEPS